MDARSLWEIEEEIYEPYELESYDRQSISDIKNSISHRFYKDKRVIKDHIEFLEHLLYKIELIRDEEKLNGYLINLDEDIKEINKLINRLKLLYNQNN